jgi:hypothetical protein
MDLVSSLAVLTPTYFTMAGLDTHHYFKEECTMQAQARISSRTVSFSWIKANIPRAIGVLLILLVIAVWRPLFGPATPLTHAVVVTPTPGPWHTGDVFVGNNIGTYKVYSNTGEYKQGYDILDPAGAYGVTGCACDQFGNQYTCCLIYTTDAAD